MSGSFIMLVLMRGGDIPQEAIQIVMAFFTTITIIALGIPIIRAVTKRWENKPQLPQQASPDVTARLERIEQAVEAVAIEVEQAKRLPRSDSAS
jgi:alanine dehydrogenase